MTDDELLAAIDASEEQALGSLQGEIASDRADAIDRYYGKPYGDEQPGRSSVVSRDVSDVVEGVLANVLKPFVGGDQVVQFDPRGPEDVEPAQQETDYVNFIALERNNGFLVLNSAVKDALLLRAGYVKCAWTTRSDVVTETYEGLAEEEIAILLKDKDVEPVQHSEYPDPYSMGAMDQMGQPMPPRMLHDLKVRRSQPTEFVEILPTPPDEILVSSRSRSPSLQEADFVQHRTNMSLSELRQMGYKVEDDIGDDEDGSTIEGQARQRFGTHSDQWEDETADPARRRVMFKETWLRIDHDGDGVAELRRVCTVGSSILANDEADIIPIACFSAILMSHQHLGLSVYDLIKDIAQIKTALTRSYLDNRYLQNNGRSIVDVNRVNLDDLLVSRPGGVVRVDGDPTTAVVPIITPDTGVGALQGLEYLDSVRENRTGYTRYAQGMDSESLINKTATGLMQATSQSQMRLEMISRTIAETGVRDLFKIIHALTLKHSTREEKIRIRNKWTVVNPREWVRRSDLSISVGLGSASQQTQLQNLMVLGQAQEKAMAMGLVQPTNVYNLLKKIVNASGFKSVEEFFSEPKKDPQTGEDIPPQPPKDPMVQAAEIKAQADMQGKQLDFQGKGQEMQMQADLDRERMGNELQLQASNDARQLEIEKYKIDKEMELRRYEAELSVQEAIAVAEIKARADRESAALQAETAQHTAAIGAEGEVRKAEVTTEGSTKQKAEREQDRNVVAEIHKAVAEMRELADAPREIVRGPDGRASGVKVGSKVRKVNRGPDGRATGLQ